MALSTRLVLATAPILALALVLSAFLLDQTAERREVDRTRSAITFLLADVRGTLEANLSIGLNLTRLRMAQDLIERRRAQNGAILAIEIFDAAGVSRFSTDRGTVGEMVPAAWLEAIQDRRDAEVWTATDANGLLFGTPLRSDIGEAIGHIVVLVGAPPGGATGRMPGSSALFSLVWVVPAVLLLLVGLITVLVRRVTADVGAATTVLLASGTDPAAPAYAGPPDSIGTDPPVLAAAAARARAMAQTATVVLDEAIAEVVRLDTVEETPHDAL